MMRCYLAIPPSVAKKGMEMIHDDFLTTNRIANVRILMREMSLLELPIAGDIVTTCCALVNHFPPLVD